MVAIFTGAGTGFDRGSGWVLGAGGLLGSTALGRGAEQLFLNAANGNFMVSQGDEFLVGLGGDASVGRTYNSLGDLSDENGDNWRQSTQRRIVNLTGTLNTAGSTVSRVSEDGSVIAYSWNTTKSAYVATDGAGAYDQLTSSGGVWTWRNGGSQVTETYGLEYGSSTSWRITAQADPDGNALAFTYLASSNKLDKVTTQDGSYVQYNWSGNNITQVVTGYTDLATSTAQTLTRTRYSYDASNRLSSVTVDLSPADNSIADGKTYTTTYTYAGTSTRVASISETDGSRIDITYDGSNRVATMAQTAATGVTRTSTLTYGAGYTTVTDPLGQVTRLDYNGDGSLAKITMPPAATGATAQTTQFSYNGNGDLTLVTDALGNASSYGNFDANGNAQTITDRLGNIVTRTFGAKNELLTETSTSSDAGSASAAHTTSYAYDGENHLRYRVSAEGLVTEYRYTGAGQLQYTIDYPEQSYSGTISETALNAWRDGLADRSSTEIVENSYDARGNLAWSESYSTATAAGAASTSDGFTKTLFVYDQAGKLLARNAQGRTVETFIYDGLGRMVSSVDVNGGTTAYVFDDANSKTVVTLASGLVQTSTYDKAGELVDFTETAASSSPAAVVGTATYGYDQLGRLRWQVDATGRKTYVIYDQAGRRIADANSLGDVTEYRYDADNRLVATIAHANRLTGTQLTSLDNASTAVDPTTLFPAADPSDRWSWNVYDKEGRLVQAIGGDGSTSVNSYDGAGRLIQTISYYNKLAAATLAGFQTTVPTAVTLPTADASRDAVSRSFYDQDGRLLGALDGEGFVTRCIYDKAGQKVEEVAFANATTGDRVSGTFNALIAGITLDSVNDRHSRYSYDGQGQLRFVIDAQYHVTETVFDSAGQATSTVRYANALASTTTDFTYDNMKTLVAAGGFASATTDRRSWAVYDNAGRIAYAIDGEGGIATFAYNASGQVIKATQFATPRATASLPDKATMDSWAAANASASTDRVTRNYYDGAGVLRYTVDPQGYVSRRTEDAEGRLSDLTRWANAITVSDSDTLATVDAGVTSSGGTTVVTSNSYDALGRLQNSTDGEGFIHRFEYNPNGTLQYDIVAYGTADESRTYFVYDGAGRVLEQHRAFGTSDVAITKYTYDGLGNVLTVTDPDNHVTTQSFDRLGQVLNRTDALGGVTAFQYDAYGNVVKVTDPLGNVTFNYYDSLGRLTTSCDALKYVTETSYTTFGEIAGVTRRYNAATNTPSVTVPPVVTADAAHDAVTSFLYDRLGRTTRTTDAQGFYEAYTLNAFGNRTSVLNKLGGTITNTFDRRGLLLSETLPMASVNSAGTQVAATVTNTFTYDSRGNRLTMVEASGLAEARTTTYTYDRLDRLTQKQGNAVTTVGSNDFTSTTAVTVTTTSGVTPTESYAYDARGNLIQLTDANGARTVSYYDDLNRKTAEVGPLGTMTRWTYDAAGNKLTERVYGDVVTVPTLPSAGPPAPINGSNYRENVYTYDLLNRLATTTIAGVLIGSWNGTTGVTTSTASVSSSLTYDADGNVITATDARTNKIYSYFDKLGRKTAELDQEGYLTSWTFDGEGNVLSERRYATKWTGAVTTSAPPAVANDNTNDRVTNFTYDRNGHRLTETRTGVVSWVINGSTGALTQNSGSATDSVVTYTYNALGQVLSKSVAGATNVAYTYDLTGRLTKESRAGYKNLETATIVTPTVDYFYNGLSNLTRTRQGDASVNATDRITTYTYGAAGRLGSMTDATGAVHTYYYDAAGSLVGDSYTRTKSDGTTQVTEGTMYRRDLLGRITAQAIATRNTVTSWTRGDSQNTQYDAYGEVSQRGVNGLWQESFTYDNMGRVQKTNTGDGVWRFFVYDANSNQTLAIESEGNDYTSTSLATVLTSLGAAAGATFVDGVNTTISIYDKRNQATQVRMPQRELATGAARVSINTSKTYNAFGEAASDTDALSATTTYTYNTMGRLIQKVMPSVSVTSATGAVSSVNPTETYYYGINGRMIGTKDANGNIVSRTLLAGTGFDGTEALVTAEFHADGGIFKTFYDVFGDTRILKNELGVNETRDYDKMGRLLTDTHRIGLVDNYTYDILGQRITHWNSALGSTVKETTDYDLQGRVVSSVDFAGDKTTQGYAWSATIATALGTSGGWTKTTTLWAGTAYSKSKTEKTDVHGLTVSETDLGANTTAYTYDKAGRLTQKVGTAGAVTTTLGYTNLNTGLTATISDSTAGLTANSITATFTYDARGLRTGEKYVGTVYKSLNDTSYTSLVGSTQTLQDATIAYNALGWLTSFSSTSSTGTVSITQAYDADGNIRRTNTTYPNVVSGATVTTDKWFTYDAFDRMVTADGVLSGGTITGGSVLAYDVVGNRKTSTKAGVTETYNYDADNQVTTVVRAGVTIASTTRDIQGRITDYVEYATAAPSGIASHRYNITYNARGQVTGDATFQWINGGTDYTATVTNQYDSYGNLIRMDSVNDSNVKDTWQSWVYGWKDSAVVNSSTFDRSTFDPNNNLYSSSQIYDGLGRLQRAFINDGAARAVHLAVTPDEQVLSRVVNDGTADNPRDYHLFISGRQIAEYTNNANEDVRNYDYNQLITDKASSASGSGDFWHGATTGTAGAETGTSGYDPINQITAGVGQSARSKYVVRAGDTLQGIASQVWGDSSLWYLLADANGLSGPDASLTAGQALSLPLKGPSNRNNADMFRPYDPASAVGDLSPTSVKPPKHNKCGAFGQVLLVAIAVAATIVLTAGVAAVAAGATFGSAFGAVTGGTLATLGATTTAAGVTGGLGAAGAIGVAAAGGALGSIVSQGVGVATGIQDKFSWKGVALSALSAGISEGVGGSGVFNSFNSTARAALNGVASSALTQGVAVITGLQDKFDWAGVAAAGVGAAAGNAIGGAKFMQGADKFTQRFASTMAGGIANAASRSLINGSDFGDNLMAALPDIVGQTIGSIVADGIEQAANQVQDAGTPLSPDELASRNAEAMKDVAPAGYPVNGGQQNNTSQPSPLTSEGEVWLKGVEVNSLTMTPEMAKAYKDTDFDSASKTYIDSTGHLTFGYGHVITADDRANGLTVAALSKMPQDEKQQLADRLFTQDVRKAYNSVVAKLGGNTMATLKPNQVDALIGTVMNAGGKSALGKTMVQYIQQGNFSAAANQFNAWNGTVNGHKQIIRGLVVRNFEERQIFTSRNYTPVGNPYDPRISAIIKKGAF